MKYRCNYCGAMTSNKSCVCDECFLKNICKACGSFEKLATISLCCSCANRIPLVHDKEYNIDTVLHNARCLYCGKELHFFGGGETFRSECDCGKWYYATISKVRIEIS